MHLMMRTLPPRQRALAKAERQTDRVVNKSHGRLEVRTLVTTTQLDAEYLNFPGVKQCFQITRTRTSTDRTTGQPKTTSEVVYGITSLSRDRADAAMLQSMIRSHWGIENKLHHVRDQTLGEDACRVRIKSAPAVLSTLRNTTLTLLRRAGHTNIAAALRTMVANPVKAIGLVMGKKTEN
jgi:predicted transposase YbfD/YdcC